MPQETHKKGRSLGMLRGGIERGGIRLFSKGGQGLDYPKEIIEGWQDQTLSMLEG